MDTAATRIARQPTKSGHTIAARSRRSSREALAAAGTCRMVGSHSKRKRPNGAGHIRMAWPGVVGDGRFALSDMGRLALRRRPGFRVSEEHEEPKMKPGNYKVFYTIG